MRLFSHTHYWYDVGTWQVIADGGGYGRSRIKRATLSRIRKFNMPVKFQSSPRFLTVSAVKRVSKFAMCQLVDAGDV